LEKHADLNVGSKADLVSALKKIYLMIGVKCNQGWDEDWHKAQIENGNLDFVDQFHPSLQERLAYLKEACDPSVPTQIQEAAACGPSVAA
jgi:hypothetical protein